MARRGRKRQLDVESLYWQLILSGVGTVAACREAGIGRKTGYRWRAENGGLPPDRLAEDVRSSRYLSLLERQRIATLHRDGLGVRHPAPRPARPAAAHPAGTGPPARARPPRPGRRPARPAATAAPTARQPAAPRRSPRPAPAARISSPLPARPAPRVFGPRRSARRLARTACTLHTAASSTRQPTGHHQLKDSINTLVWASG
jgi:hypothetical protein